MSLLIVHSAYSRRLSKEVMPYPLMPCFYFLLAAPPPWFSCIYCSRDCAGQLSTLLYTMHALLHSSYAQRRTSNCGMDYGCTKLYSCPSLKRLLITTICVRTWYVCSRIIVFCTLSEQRALRIHHYIMRCPVWLRFGRHSRHALSDAGPMYAQLYFMCAPLPYGIQRTHRRTLILWRLV